MLSFFPRDVFGEILNLIESISEGFPSYSSTTKFLLLSLNVVKPSNNNNVVFSLSEFRKRIARSHVMKEKRNCKSINRVQKFAKCTLRDLAGILDIHGRHSMLSYLSSLPISVLQW